MKKLILKNKCRYSLFDMIDFSLMTLVCVVTLYPILYVLAVSLSDKLSVLQNTVFLIPRGFNINAYLRIFNTPLFVQSYFNTITYVILGTFASVLINMLTAYPLSKKNLKGGSIILKAIIFSMLFSGGIIPYYLLIKQIGMIDSIWVMVIPGAISPMYIIIMRTFIKGIPEELEEAAKIDGSNYIQIFIKVIIPLSKPVIATISLFVSVGIWNSYFGPLIFLNTREKFPLQLILRSILITNEINQLGRIDVSGETITPTSIKYASIISAIIPIMSVYPFVQKYFVKGMLIGSIKG